VAVPRGAGGPPGGGGGRGGFEDILRDMFGGRARGGPQHFETEDFASNGGGGQDIAVTLTITLPEAAKGASTRVRLPTGKEVEVKIPAGITTGQQVRLKGQGYPGAVGRAGDVIITITVAPHPVFKVEGDDLRIELPITFYEATLGGKVRVPTLEGAVELAIPPDTNSGRTFRLKGKGLKIKGTKTAGDLLATVRVVMPDKATDDIKELAKKFRDEKPYDPRKDLS
jgi:DnaJ-class molecular chaperone